MEYINREFKAVVQDMTHVYLGAQMSVEELNVYEDVPFKIKAIFHKYFSNEEQKGESIGNLLGNLSRDDFAFQAVKQLKLKFKVGFYINSNGKEIYKSKTLNPEEYIDVFSSEDKFFAEEVVFNKLSLLAFST